MNDYLIGLITDRSDCLNKIYDEAVKNHIPIVREDMASLLKVIVHMMKPGRILEAGTAIGYSSILMAEASSSDCIIDTVEIDPDLVVVARENIKRANLEERIHVIAGDMQDVFACLDAKYDMIFLDGAKSRYIDVYDDILRLLKVGGVLLCDNISYHGKIYDEPKFVDRKHRTIVANLRSFLERLTSDDRFVTSILETGDGIAISTRIK